MDFEPSDSDLAEADAGQDRGDGSAGPGAAINEGGAGRHTPRAASRGRLDDPYGRVMQKNGPGSLSWRFITRSAAGR